MGVHPSHETRASDASTFDEICVKCGRTDEVPGGWGLLAEPCPKEHDTEKRWALPSERPTMTTDTELLERLESPLMRCESKEIVQGSSHLGYTPARAVMDEQAARANMKLAAERIRSLQGEVEDCKRRLGDPNAQSAANAYWKAKAKMNRDELDRLRPLKSQLSEAKVLLVWWTEEYKGLTNRELSKRVSGEVFQRVKRTFTFLYRTKPTPETEKA